MSLIGHNLTRTKPLNRALVLECLRRNGPLPRIEIAQRTRLTPATITNLVTELLEEGYLHEAGIEPDTSGRPGRRSSLLRIAGQARSVVGVHIRSDRVTLALVNLGGEVAARSEFSIEPGDSPDSLTRRVIEAVRQKAAESPSPVIGVGVGSAGHVDSRSGIIIRMKYLGWENVPLGARLEEALGLPVVVDHNVRGMAVAETLFGPDREAEDLLFLYVGRGVGAGVILGGVPFRGGTGAAAEIGHTTLVENGPLCWCGNRGCLELFTSEPAVLRQAETLLGSLDPQDPLNDLLHSGEEVAGDLLAGVGQQLGLALANAVSLFNLRLVVLGGRIFGDSRVVEALEGTVNRRAFLRAGEAVRCRRSVFPAGDVGTVGGAALAFDRLVFHPQLSGLEGE